MRPDEGRHLMLYDGVCGLCNTTNQFVLRFDRGHRFNFASLQSAAARELLGRLGSNAAALTTFYVVSDYQGESPVVMTKSRAALFLMRQLGWPWRGAAVLGVLPRSWLDWGYDFVARNRYRLFGRYEQCPLPPPEHRGRFLGL